MADVVVGGCGNTWVITFHKVTWNPTGRYIDDCPFERRRHGLHVSLEEGRL